MPSVIPPPADERASEKRISDELRMLAAVRKMAKAINGLPTPLALAAVAQVAARAVDASHTTAAGRQHNYEQMLKGFAAVFAATQAIRGATTPVIPAEITDKDRPLNA